jgi:hypothetical protein
MVVERAWDHCFLRRPVSDVAESLFPVQASAQEGSGAPVTKVEISHEMLRFPHELRQVMRPIGVIPIQNYGRYPVCE